MLTATWTHILLSSSFQRMIIIRAPSIFRYVWAVAKHFFRQSARNKMIFASKNYVEVLDNYIDRHVLPPSIAPGGYGQVAIGQPPLIGDVSLDKEALQLSKKALDTSYWSLPCTVALGESDDDSASSNELSPFDVSVSGSTLMTGHWKESGGGSQVFSSPFA